MTCWPLPKWVPVLTCRVITEYTVQELASIPASCASEDFHFSCSTSAKRCCMPFSWRPWVPSIRVTSHRNLLALSRSPRPPVWRACQPERFRCPSLSVERRVADHVLHVCWPVHCVPFFLWRHVLLVSLGRTPDLAILLLSYSVACWKYHGRNWFPRIGPVSPTRFSSDWRTRSDCSQTRYFQVRNIILSFRHRCQHRSSSDLCWLSICRCDCCDRLRDRFFLPYHSL